VEYVPPVQIDQYKKTPITSSKGVPSYETSQLSDKVFYKKVLNDKFDDMLNSYNDEKEVECEEMDEALLESHLDDLLTNPDYQPNGYSLRTHSTFTEKVVKVVQDNVIEKINPNNVVPKHEIIEIILAAHENQSDPDTDEDVLAPYLIEKEKEWDCESIISTYSNLENHPTLISEDKPNRIKLSRKTGMPLNVLPKTEKIKGGDTVTEKGRKGESKDEKKARKLATKQEKKVNRIEKKATKQAFKREEQKQQHILAIPEQQQRIVVKY
jgi:protein LTV1